MISYRLPQSSTAFSSIGICIAGSAKTCAGVFFDRGVLGAGAGVVGAGIPDMGGCTSATGGVVEGPDPTGMTSSISVTERMDDSFVSLGNTSDPGGGVRITPRLEGLNA